MDNNRTPNGGDNNKKNNKNRQNMLMFFVFMLIGMFVWGFISRMFADATNQEITYDAFVTMLENDEVIAVEETYNTWKITPKEQPIEGVQITYYTGIMNDDSLLPLMREKGIEIKPYSPDTTSGWIFEIVSIILPLVLIWVVFSFAMRHMGGGGVMGVGKSKAKVYIQKETGILFKDVAGQDEAKES